MKNIILILILCLGIKSNAEIRYVSHRGSSTPPYTSWATACDSIQKCVNYSQSGDTIYVDEGTFREKIVLKIGISLIGGGMEKTIIDIRSFASSSGWILAMYDSCKVIGFKFIGNNGNSICISGSGAADAAATEFAYNYFTNSFTTIPTVMLFNIYNANCSIHNNILTNGGNAIDALGCLDSVKLYIRDNYFTSINTAMNSIWPYVYIEFCNNTVFVDSDFLRFGYFNGNSIVRNNLIINKSTKNNYNSNATYGGNVQSRNNYFFSNSCLGNYSLEETPSLINDCVVTPGYGVYYYPVQHNATIKYNNFWKVRAFTNEGTVDTSVNYNFDPMVMNSDPDNYDAHLQQYSPLIDRGDPAIKDADGSRSDIGLYGGPKGQSYPYIDLAPHAPVNLTYVYSGKTLTLKWNKNTEADFDRYNIYEDTVRSFIPDSARLVQSGVDTVYSIRRGRTNTTYYYKLTAVDKQGNISAPSDEISVNLTNVDEPVIKMQDYALYDAYPNPFNPSATIGYRLNKKGYVRLVVYNIQGQLVKTLVDGPKDAGTYEIKFTAHNQRGNGLASGIYIYKLDVYNSNNIPVYNSMKKMILVK
jgi:hypothetical protein